MEERRLPLKNSAPQTDKPNVPCLCDVFRQLGNSLDLAETLSTLDAELRRLVRYDTMSVHLVEDGRLTPAYAAGPGFQVLGALELNVGSGLLGSVAETRHPVLNGGPDGSRGLTTALAAPLEWRGRVTAVLALYRTGPDPFAAEDLELVSALAPKLAASMDNAQRFSRAHQAWERVLFERLDAEVARARRAGDRLAVVVCQVEGLDPEGAAAARIAGELRHLCREYDFVAGSGDSLVMVLPGFGPAGMVEKQARIHSVFQRAGLAAAIGAAFLPEDGSDAEDLMAAACAASHACC